MSTKLGSLLKPIISIDCVFPPKLNSATPLIGQSTKCLNDSVKSVILDSNDKKEGIVNLLPPILTVI